MRKITENAVNALRNGNNFSSGNTTVNAETATLLLHGNAVAGYDKSSFWFNLCGWNTNTTRERINGALPRGNICTKQGTVYFVNNGKRVEIPQCGRVWLNDLI